MKLSILIPTIPIRENQLNELLIGLFNQCGGLKNVVSKMENNVFFTTHILKDVEIITALDNKEKTVGHKRQMLQERAKGDYICFVDDDDCISRDYIEKILTALESSPDCCSLTGEITFNGKNPKIFVHSLLYNSYFEKDNIYFRPPNHLNVIKRELVKSVQFTDQQTGEDTIWAMEICNRNLLNKEEKIEGILYFYNYDETKTETQ